MFVLTLVVIYTQSLWVRKVTIRIFPNGPKDHFYGYQFFNMLIIVTLATFVLFPVVTRLLSFWLTPGVNYKAKVMELAPCLAKKPEAKSKL
jgi:antibiotic biosynthesis monooxygenase (ABM) superfamily enzyme